MNLEKKLYKSKKNRQYFPTKGGVSVKVSDLMTKNVVKILVVIALRVRHCVVVSYVESLCIR